MNKRQTKKEVLMNEKALIKKLIELIEIQEKIKISYKLKEVKK